MNQAHAVRFRQRAADLEQDMDDAALGLRAELPHELVEVDAAQVLHRVIEQPVGRASVVIDRDGVGVGKLAGDLDFVLEARDVRLVGHVRAQQLDGHRAAQQRMPCAVHHAVGPAPDLLHQHVLAQPARGQRASPHRSLQPLHEHREPEDGGAAEHQQ